MKKAISVLLSLCMLLCVAVPVFAEETPNEPLHYLLIGDSITLGQGVYNRDDACYGKIVADTNGYTYENLSVNGYRTQDVLALLQETETVNSVKNADIINISVGGNDFLQQNIPLLLIKIMMKNEENLDDIEEDLYENFSAIIETIKEINPDATILVQNLYNPRFDLLRDFYGNAVNRVNRSIENYLASNPDAFILVDTIPVMENHPEHVAIDTVHPSATGNEVLAKLILKTLYELGLGTQTEPVINSVGIDYLPYSSFVFQKIFQFFRDILGNLNFFA